MIGCKVKAINGILKMDTPLDFNFGGTRARSPPKDAMASFLVCLFHTFGLVGTKPQSENKSLA
jgi:hypothetical protein